MTSKHRKKMAIYEDLLPPDVYEILNIERNKRNLAQYIIECVQFKEEHLGYIETVKRIENKLDNMEFRIISSTSANNMPSTYNSKKNNKETVTEGQIIKGNKISGGIDKDDLEENDF